MNNAKTKFILHGGFSTTRNGDNDKFFQEILNLEKKELKILCVLFAKEEKEYNDKKDKLMNLFEVNNKRHKILNFEIASKKELINQIKSSDIIYLYGGETMQLLTALRVYSGFKDSIRGKVVAGESAGAYVLSSCFYSKTSGGVFKGLGYVPVKTICHYTGENKEKLEDCPNNLEYLLLERYKYKIFNI
jgi:peptidase E